MDFSYALKKHYSEMSPGKRLVADFICENKHIAAYCSASSLASRVGVSNAQIGKFVKELGFHSYKEMQCAICEEQESKKFTMAEQFASWNAENQGDLAENCMKVLEQDLENIRGTMGEIPMDSLIKVAEKIATARRVAFVGARGAAGCNTIPATFLGQMRENVFLIRPDISTSMDLLSWWGEEDFVLGISTYSYGSGFAPELLHLAHKQGCTTAWFTDRETFLQTPEVDYDYVFQFATKNVMISYTSLLVIFNILCYMVSTMLPNSEKRITQTERMLQLNIDRKDHNPENLRM